VAPETGAILEEVAGPAYDGQAQPSKSFWARVPPPVAFPRLGDFVVLPSGPGYYSLLDLVTGNYRDKPPIYPLPPFGLDVMPFYDNNFRYLDNPDNTQVDLFDPIKRLHLGDNWLLSIGGEERVRFAHEWDSRLTGKVNNFELFRSRVYGDLWFQDRFRLFVEYIDAQTHDQNLAPLATDVNKSDLLNLFIDVKLIDLCEHPVYARGGRQELYYGSQRLISQTEWPNALRTFDGAKIFYRGDKLDVDGFWTRPVVIDPSRFDSENDKAQFAGLWSTYRPAKGQAIDLYYLYLENNTPLTKALLPGRGGFDVNTMGGRYAGDYKWLLWDFEGMYQFGEHANQSTSAGAATTGLGVHFADLPMNPHFWALFDYASGSDNPGKGDYGTFNQLYPNGHAYFGWTDLVGRQNIEDLNFQVNVYPTKWINTGVMYHILRLDSAKDALYNAAGAVERVDPTGKAGTDVGDILTIYTNFHLGMHSDILVQYSHLYAGTFIKDTGSPLSPDFFYVQYTFRW